MAGKVLIDMIKLRSALAANSGLDLPEALYYTSGNTNGLKTIRELASFAYTCRKCEDSPCIAVCPADALEKDAEGIIVRYSNLCVSCKSCVTICPFGTMMTDFFQHHRKRDLIFDLTDEKDVERFIKASPPCTVELTDEEECPEKNIYRLNEMVLIKELLYNTEK